MMVCSIEAVEISCSAMERSEPMVCYVLKPMAPLLAYCNINREMDK